MIVSKTDIPDLLVLEPKVFRDERGYFFESYNKDKFIQAGLEHVFVQDNQSKSSYGVIRGLHYQLAPYSQTKLVRVLSGRIYDVAVDIRRNSPTFGKWFGIELSAENNKQLLVPRGFAHGFSVLSEFAEILYKCDSLYKPDAERGICYNSPFLNIDWHIKGDELVSTRDKVFPDIQEAEMNFVYGEV